MPTYMEVQRVGECDRSPPRMEGRVPPPEKIMHMALQFYLVPIWQLLRSVLWIRIQNTSAFRSFKDPDSKYESGAAQLKN